MTAGLSCSFCGKSQEAVSKLFASKGRCICNECVGGRAKVFLTNNAFFNPQEPVRPCRFCHSGEDTPPHEICVDCLDLCLQILIEEAEHDENAGVEDALPAFEKNERTDWRFRLEELLKITTAAKLV